MENEILYGRSFEVSDEVLDKDYVTPIGKVDLIHLLHDVCLTNNS